MVEAFPRGREAQARLRTAPCHLLIVELELGDMLGVELGRAAQQDRQAGAVMLMDDPAKSGMIVSALSRGLETYVPVPPDEAVFLERIEMLLLAQWGLVLAQQQSQVAVDLASAREAAAAAEEKATRAQKDGAERVAAAERLGNERVARLEVQHRELKSQLEAVRRSAEQAATEARTPLENDLRNERKLVGDLRREIALLRDQLASMHVVTGARSGLSDEGGPTTPALVGGPPSASGKSAPTSGGKARRDPSPAPAPLGPGSSPSQREKDRLPPAAPATATLRDGVAPPRGLGGTGMRGTNAGAKLHGDTEQNEGSPSLFDDDKAVDNGKDPARRSSLNDEETAPGGHSISMIQSQLANEEKAAALKKERARAASPRHPDALFQNLPDLPGGEEEVLFLEDE
jgi:DNA-binding NarL/FixJ family response regulator